MGKRRLMGLVDDLSRYVGAIWTSTRTGRWIEYGCRDADGILHVAGIGRVTRLSEITDRPSTRDIREAARGEYSEPGCRIWS